LNALPPSVILAAHLALLSSISFGGFPTVLPDVHDLVAAKGWVSDREFANIFAISQVMPGPNMILMMSFIGSKWEELREPSPAQWRPSGRHARYITGPTGYGIGSVRCPGSALYAARLRL